MCKESFVAFAVSQIHHLRVCILLFPLHLNMNVLSNILLLLPLYFNPSGAQAFTRVRVCVFCGFQRKGTILVRLFNIKHFSSWVSYPAFFLTPWFTGFCFSPLSIASVIFLYHFRNSLHRNHGLRRHQLHVFDVFIVPHCSDPFSSTFFYILELNILTTSGFPWIENNVRDQYSNSWVGYLGQKIWLAVNILMTELVILDTKYC